MVIYYSYYHFAIFLKISNFPGFYMNNLDDDFVLHVFVIPIH